jgi:hypothetical protein
MLQTTAMNTNIVYREDAVFDPYAEGDDVEDTTGKASVDGQAESDIEDDDFANVLVSLFAILYFF